MTIAAFAVAYVGLAVFLLAVIARVIMWARLPMHVRWELYPVAHEGKRAAYGGSYLEDQFWWKKPRQTSMIGELKVMVPEILFLVALFEHNRKLWLRSFPFHFGIYLVIGCTALMMGTGVLSVVAPGMAASQAGVWLADLTVAVGALGLGLGILGGLGLLQRRLTDPALKDFTAPADILNLLLFLVAFGVALAHLIVVDRDLSRSQAFVTGLVTFRLAVVGGAATLTMATVVLLGLLVAYIPLTHMSHFVGKYFAYHAIRWNDTPNLRGGNQEKAIHEVLNYPVSWAAPHIGADGKKTWAQVATEEVKR
jgi:nitrate reductase gamma subunit